MSKKEFDDDRFILLNDIEENSISAAIHNLFTLAQKDKNAPINIIINTFGGVIYDMFALYDAIKYVQSLGVPITTIGLGKIMSAGVILLVSGDIRKLGKNATIMWHWGSDSIEGDIFGLKNELGELERLDNLCNDILSSETNMAKKDIENLLSSRLDAYIDSDKALEYGMIDEILETSSKSKTRAKKTTKRTTKK